MAKTEKELEKEYLIKYSKYLCKHAYDIIKTDNGFEAKPLYHLNEENLFERNENKEIEHYDAICGNCYKCSHSFKSSLGVMDQYECEILNQLLQVDEFHVMTTDEIERCDAFNEINKLTLIKSKEEMIDFIKNTSNFFDSPESYEEYYGFERKWDEATGEILETTDEYICRGGEFKKIPEEYPCVIFFDLNTDEPLDWIKLEDKSK